MDQSCKGMGECASPMCPTARHMGQPEIHATGVEEKRFDLSLCCLLGLGACAGNNAKMEGRD